MRPLVVVENPKRWPFEMEGVDVVSARAYVTDPRYAEGRRSTVFNVCRRYGYQTLGYYVSLLAEARGHRPLPSVATLQTFSMDPVVRIVSDDLDERIQKDLKPLKSDEFVLSIYFGKNVARRYDRLARALFNQFPAPFLRARFVRESERWRLSSIRPIAGGEVPESHRDFVLERAAEYFRRPTRVRTSGAARYDLAVLWSPDDPLAPSDDVAIRRFTRAAARRGISVETISVDDYGRLGEFDALFLRETTRVDHHTFRFARRAAAEGLVVLDDPESIVRCGNKVYQAELFERHGVPSPRTLVVHEGNVNEIEDAVGMPCVLKKPDGAFSQGVVKAMDREDLAVKLSALLDESDLVVAQAFRPSDFDWRVGVLDGRALFAARYHMARGHWQIVSESGTTRRFGKVEALAVDDAPADVVEIAVRAASLIGDGLYGVDLKEIDCEVLVMEVNDNPNLDAGFEDAVLKSRLWDEVAGWFSERLDRRGRTGRSDAHG